MVGRTECTESKPPTHPVALQILEPLRVLFSLRCQNGTRLVHVHGALGIVPLILRDKADYHGGAFGRVW